MIFPGFAELQSSKHKVLRKLIYLSDCMPQYFINYVHITKAICSDIYCAIRISTYSWFISAKCSRSVIFYAVIDLLICDIPDANITRTQDIIYIHPRPNSISGQSLLFTFALCGISSRAVTGVYVISPWVVTLCRQTQSQSRVSGEEIILKLFWL